MFSEIHLFEPTWPSDRLWRELHPVAEDIVVASVKLTEKPMPRRMVRHSFWT